MEKSSHSSTGSLPIGCGLLQSISIHVSPTTGGDFYLTVDPELTVDALKKIISKRLKLPRDRISLLFRDKQLQEGNITNHGIIDGSKIILLPNVETGLITQRPELGIMHALESLNENQVNEFLCGKAPLNLSMRLGDHMMLIQLQLSTITSNSNNISSNSSNPTTISTTTTTTHTTTIPLSKQNFINNDHHETQTFSSSPLTPNSSKESSALSTPPPQLPSSRVPSLLQASKNLQHTLRRLSADVFAGKSSNSSTSSRRESVYSGTFSGALNPALQDPRGRPRRDVATIVHILNDLLCSVPEFRRVHSYKNKNDTNIQAINQLQHKHQINELIVSGNGTSTETQPTLLTTNNNKAPIQQQLLENNINNIIMDDQNMRTRGKLEQLRLVMDERRERRRMRKSKPYDMRAAQTPPPLTDNNNNTVIVGGT